MEYSNISKRLVAAFVDYFILLIIFMIIGYVVLNNVFYDIVNQQMAPFVIIKLIITPLLTIFDICLYPQAYGNGIPYIFILVVYFIAEVLYFSILEISPTRRSIGTSFMNIEIKYSSLNIQTVIVRNTLKAISKYLFGVMTLTMFFSKKKQALYDIVTKTILIDTKSLS